MKKLTIAVIVLAILAASPAWAQDVSKFVERLSSEMDFGDVEFDNDPPQEALYAVVNPKAIFIDVDEKARQAIIYFRSHPVHKYGVSVWDYKSAKISIAGRYIDFAHMEKGRFLRIDKASKTLTAVREVYPCNCAHNRISKLEIIALPTGKTRFLIIDPLEMRIHFGAFPPGNWEAEFQVNDHKLFREKVSLLKTGDKKDPEVWVIRSMDILMLHRKHNILYFPTGHPKGTWAQVRLMK